MDFIINKFLVERGPVTDNKNGSYLVYYRVFYADDLDKGRTLFKGSATYDGDQETFRQKVIALLTKLDNTDLDNAIEEIDQVLNTLSGT